MPAGRKFEHKDKKKGYDRSYEFFAGDGNLLTACDVFGECIKAPTVYHNPDKPDLNFRMRAKGKVFNATYFVEDDSGAQAATITRKGVGFRWKIIGPDKQELARIIDPASNTEAFFRELLAAQPDSYALVIENQLIATIANEKRLEPLRTEAKNIVGKLLQKVIPETGLTLRFEPGQDTRINIRILIAALTLLQVHDITGVNRY